MTLTETCEVLNMSITGLMPHCRRFNISNSVNSKTIFSKEDLYKIANAIDFSHKNNEKKNRLDLYFKQALTKHNATERILELRKEHPLVIDDNMFSLSYFPPIDNYEFLTECNTVLIRS